MTLTLNEQIFEFLDDTETISHNESKETLLVCNFPLSYKKAEEYVLAWMIERA